MIRKIVDYLGSLRHSLAVILLVTLACIAGTLIPQGSDVARYLNVYPSEAKTMELLVAAGFTNIFSAWWFMLLLVLLAVSLVICTARRCSVAVKLQGALKIRAIASTVTHISFVLILAGAVIRGEYGHKGTMSFRQGETMDSFSEEAGFSQLPFSVHLKKFEIETYASDSNQPQNVQIVSEQLVVSKTGADVIKTLPINLGDEQAVVSAGDPASGVRAISVRIRRKVLDFVIDTATREVVSRSENPVNPAILVDVIEGGTTNQTRWLFARYPDFDMGGGLHQAATSSSGLKMRYDVEIVEPPVPRVKSYKSTLQIIEGSVTKKEVTVEVNSPFSYKGYTFYQSGYNPEDPLWTSLQVVNDPGVPVVYAGFLMMILGLFVMFGVQIEDKKKE